MYGWGGWYKRPESRDPEPHEEGSDQEETMTDPDDERKDKPRWKLVTRSEDYTDYTDRLKVPGGWLYRSTQSQNPESPTESMMFVPFPLGHVGWHPDMEKP